MQVDIWHGKVLTHPAVPIVAGTITADRGNKVRLNSSITLAMTPDEATGIDTRHCRYTVSRGIESMGVQERQMLGAFRVDEVTRTEYGQIDITGGGLEEYVIDARFLRPRTPPWGSSTIGQISQLIKEVIPSADVRRLNTQNRLITATAPWTVERWDAIEALADSLTAEIFVNPSGQFVIKDQPDLISAVPVYLINEGAEGVLIGRTVKDSRDQVYNAVSVSGASSDPNVPPVWAWAYDSDPTSPTFYYADPLDGGFGQVPRFYQSQFFTSNAQCQVTANNLLAQSLAENRTLSFSTIPLSFLEVGDTVSVEQADGSLENHLVQKLQCTLDIQGTMSCETLASKVIARAVL